MTEEIDINKIYEHPTPTGPVKITFARPPVWDSVCSAFEINPTEAVFTYGDTIYNPNMKDLPAHIIEHERVHMTQHDHTEEGAALWWGKFLRDPQFRVDQEAQAYAAQYDFICKTTKGREQRFKVRMDLARVLSGPLYKKAVTTMEARRLIEQYSKTKV